jgi:serine/threonine protein kinase
LYLSAVSGPDAGRVFAVHSKQVNRVGRGADCEILLRDPSVSRVHFEIRVEEGRALLRDVGSRWGTVVNGVKTESHELRAGDIIQFGETELQWLLEARPEATTLAPHAPWGPPWTETGDLRHRPIPELPPIEAFPPAAQAGKPVAITPETLVPSALVGRRFADYLVEQIHARSRSGVVFLALAGATVPVALKVLWPERMQSPEAMSRFLRAIKTMLPYRHPNLVTLLDAGVTDGLCWMATEFVAGESAKQVIRRVGVAGMLDWTTVLRVAVDIAGALELAASHNIVHRNITPTNILIRQSDGVAKLGDLLLAKALDELGPDRVTRAGEIVGDLLFLSPEQASGERVDHRSDLYSLGATLYAMLTGRPPCEGQTLAESVRNIQTQAPVPPKKYHLAIPDLFEAVVLRLLAKRPDDRFSDASGLLQELDRVERYTKPVESRKQIE